MTDRNAMCTFCGMVSPNAVVHTHVLHNKVYSKPTTRRKTNHQQCPLKDSPELPLELPTRTTPTETATSDTQSPPTESGYACMLCEALRRAPARRHVGVQRPPSTGRIHPLVSIVGLSGPI